MDLLKTFCRLVGEKFCFNSNLQFEQAVDLILNRLEGKQGMKVTFFFPRDSDLEPVSVYGAVPLKGQEVFFNPLESNNRYRDWFGWRVKSISYSVIPYTDRTKAIQRMMESGQDPNHYESQVQLFKGRKWSDAYPVRSDNG
jgi:hypothetical protein